VSWQPTNWRTLGERPAVTPSVGGLVYPGRRHVFSGLPEACKTWAAFALAIDEIRAGGVVVHVDFEMFEFETRDRLRSMGLSDDELERFVHIEPDVPATDAIVGELVESWHPTLVIIDAAAGAYDLQQLDDNKRQDVEVFARSMIEPFRARDVATIVLDHVTKSREGRGSFSIGSERKIGGADVHLGFEMVVPFGRGRVGLVRIVTHKDRLGYLPRPRAAELELRSDAVTGAVTWTFRPAELAGDEFRPTVLMESVSRFLEEQTEPVSRNGIEHAVTGKAKFVRAAMDLLVAEGFVEERPGPRRSSLLVSAQPFRADTASAPRPSKEEGTRDAVASSASGRSQDALGTQSGFDLGNLA
jgi:hypothetical protein